MTEAQIRRLIEDAVKQLEKKLIALIERKK